MLYFLWLSFDSLWHRNVLFIWKLEKLKLSLEISSNSSRYALPRNPGNRGSDTLAGTRLNRWSDIHLYSGKKRLITTTVINQTFPILPCNKYVKFIIFNLIVVVFLRKITQQPLSKQLLAISENSFTMKQTKCKENFG